MANLKTNIKLSTTIKKLLLATTFISTSIVAAEAISNKPTTNNVDATKTNDLDVANIAKLLEHAKSSMHNLETFYDGLTSFDLVLSQPEVILALQHNNSKNSLPAITRLYLPSKTMGICKELFSFYEKNSKELEPYKEKISDIIASIGMLWPNTPINKLLEKQNLMSWANKIFYKERVDKNKDKLEKQTSETQKDSALNNNNKVAGTNSSWNKDNQSRATNESNAVLLYTITSGVTRKRKGSTCSQCSKDIASTRKPTQTAKPTDVSVTRKGSVKMPSKENLPWMAKQTSPSENSPKEKPDIRTQRTLARRKPQAEDKQKKEPSLDPDSLQALREGKPVENPKNPHSSSPSNISGSNLR